MRACQGPGLELFDGDDGPLERVVQRLVRGVDGNRTGEQLFIRRGVGLIGGGDAGVELLKGGAEIGGIGGGAVGGHGHEQRVEPPVVADRVDVQLELDRMDLRAFLVGCQNAGARAGHGDGRGEVGIIRVQHVEAAGLVIRIGSGSDPFGAGNAFVAFRPHPAQFGGEAQGEVRGVKAVKFKQNHRAGSRRRVGRRKHDLPHCERNMGVGEDGAVGMHLDLCGLLVDVDGNGVPLDVRLDGQVAQDLDGEDPRFECTVLLPHEDAAFACHREGLLRFRVGADDRAGGVKRNGRDGTEVRRRRLGLGWRLDCGRWGKEQGQSGPGGYAQTAYAAAHCVVL